MQISQHLPHFIRQTILLRYQVMMSAVIGRQLLARGLIMIQVKLKHVPPHRSWLRHELIEGFVRYGKNSSTPHSLKIMPRVRTDVQNWKLGRQARICKGTGKFEIDRPMFCSIYWFRLLSLWYEVRLTRKTSSTGLGVFNRRLALHFSWTGRPLLAHQLFCPQYDNPAACMFCTLFL